MITELKLNAHVRREAFDTWHHTARYVWADLLRLALPVVEHYPTDLHHDAITLQERFDQADADGDEQIRFSWGCSDRGTHVYYGVHSPDSIREHVTHVYNVTCLRNGMATYTIIEEV